MTSRAVCIVLLLGLIAAPAVAQDAGQPTPPAVPVTASPLGPLGGPATPPPQPASPGGLRQGAPPNPPQADAGAPGAATQYAPAPAVPQVWLPRGTAEVQALDKVNARNAILTVKVGQSTTFGSLTIAVQACVVTPPDQPQDAAAFLVITDGHSGEPGFSGWMVAAAPSASMLQNPIYDVRVTGCRT